MASERDFYAALEYWGSGVISTITPRKLPTPKILVLHEFAPPQAAHIESPRLGKVTSPYKKQTSPVR